MFEEEGDGGLLAVIAYRAYPLRLHGPRPWPALPADDDPGDSGEVNLWEWTEERFKGEEACQGRRVLKMPDPGERGLIFDRYPTPDMLRGALLPIPAPEVGPHQGTALGEDLEDMPVCRLHCAEHLVNEGRWHLLVEEVAHGVDEDQARHAPRERLVEAFGARRQVEPLLKGVAGQTAEAFGKSFGVAMVTAARDLGTPGDGIPGGVCPLNG